MATNKPISTISYNSEEFLVSRLNEWYQAHLIQCWQYIKHKGEDGDKDHIHLRIEPNKRIDPMDLTQILMEYDPNHVKPLGCRPWRPSKEEDWFLYAIHDTQYLKIKYSDSKDGKLPYKVEDIKASDGYDIETAVLRARQSLENHTACMIKELKQGRRAAELIEEGKDVFRIQAVLRSLQTTEFEDVLSHNQMLEKYIIKLEKAINSLDLEIQEQENNIVLVKKGK